MLAPVVKLCPSCEERKPLREYHSSFDSWDLHKPRCRACAATRERAYKDRQGDRYLTRRRDNYATNREVRRAKAREKYYRLPEAARQAAWRRQGINITWDGYLDFLSSQNGQCAICKRGEVENGKALAVDHDHHTGVVRGLLCDDCNIALGRFQENTETLRRAIAYLTQEGELQWQ